MVVGGLLYGAPVAVKLPLSDFKSGDLRKVPELANELRVLRLARHPNLVQMIGAVLDPEQRCLALVLELVDGPSLDAFMSETGTPTLATQFQIIIGVCRALWYLHSRDPQIVHGDLKGGNVLIERARIGVSPKLLDFGLARLLTRRSKTSGGTLRWMPPEFFNDRRLTPAASTDVWALGHLIFFVVTGIRPFEGMGSKDIAECLKSASLPEQVWPGVSKLEAHCKPVVSACLQLVSSSRATMEEIHHAIVAWASTEELFRQLRLTAAKVVPEGACEWNLGLGRLWRPFSAKERPLCQLDASDISEHSSQEEDSPAQLGEMQATLNSQLAVPALMLPTANHARKACLVDAMLKWNYELPMGVCCKFHAGVQAIQTTCSELTSLRCTDRVFPDANAQCPICGMLSDADDDSVSVGDSCSQLCWICIRSGAAGPTMGSGLRGRSSQQPTPMIAL